MRVCFVCGQPGAQLTGAVKKASPADESIGEIPVPDLPEGTWDKHHRSSSINFKKRVMRSMIGGEQSSRRGGYGPKRAKGGPRILRSAGQASTSTYLQITTLDRNRGRTCAGGGGQVFGVLWEGTRGVVLTDWGVSSLSSILRLLLPPIDHFVALLIRFND